MTEEMNQSTEEEFIMEFPCQFPIKAMGKAADDFDSLVVGIIRKHVSDLMEGAVKIRSSNGGKYVSVTVTIEAISKQQLDDIYIELSSHERVIMAI